MSAARSVLTNEQSREIVARVLGNETALSKGDFDLLSQGLEIASEPEFYAVRLAKWRNEEHENRKQRIALLEAVLQTYEPISHCPSDGVEGGRMISTMHYYMRLRGNDAGVVLKGIRDMIEVETIEHELNPYIPIPNARPVSAKNGGAEHMFVVLREAGIDAWKACSVIAEILITAGLEEKPHDKVLRALYDKLSRIDLSKWGNVR